MHSRAVELLNILGMRPHPEGGHYIELFRSAHRVEVLDRSVERALVREQLQRARQDISPKTYVRRLRGLLGAV